MFRAQRHFAIAGFIALLLSGMGGCPPGAAPSLLPPVDEDGDGLTFDQEMQFGTDPTKADTDGDGWNDYTELFIAPFTNPLSADTDLDTIPDRFDPEPATYNPHAVCQRVLCDDFAEFENRLIMKAPGGGFHFVQPGFWALSLSTGGYSILDSQARQNYAYKFGVAFTEGRITEIGTFTPYYSPYTYFDLSDGLGDYFVNPYDDSTGNWFTGDFVQIMIGLDSNGLPASYDLAVNARTCDDVLLSDLH